MAIVAHASGQGSGRLIAAAAGLEVVGIGLAGAAVALLVSPQHVNVVTVPATTLEVARFTPAPTHSTRTSFVDTRRAPPATRLDPVDLPTVASAGTLSDGPIVVPAAPARGDARRQLKRAANDTVEPASATRAEADTRPQPRLSAPAPAAAPPAFALRAGGSALAPRGVVKLASAQGTAVGQSLPGTRPQRSVAEPIRKPQRPQRRPVADHLNVAQAHLSAFRALPERNELRDAATHSIVITASALVEARTWKETREPASATAPARAGKRGARGPMTLGALLQGE